MGIRNKVAAAAMLAVVVLLAAGCRNKQAGTVAPSEAPALSVKVVQVQAEPFSATVAVTGNLVSRSQVVVKAEIIGKIVKFPKQEGDSVEQGEAVAWVDEENYRLAVRQAETAVQVAQASLERVRVTAEHNAAELERAKNLIKSGGITDKDLKTSQVAHLDTQAQAALAQAQLEQAQAALEVSRKHLRDTAIRAPVAGVIEQKFINPGAYVEAPTQVFTVVDNRRLELESPVPAAQLGQIRAGQSVAFGVNSYPETVFQGRVIEINPAVDPMTRSAKVRIAAGPSVGKLRAGMFATGEILTGVQQRAIVVPAVAVYRGDGTTTQAYVFVAENGKTLRKTVRIGRETDGKLEITEGLKPGEVLIAEQRIELADGVRVEPGR